MKMLSCLNFDWKSVDPFPKLVFPFPYSKDWFLDLKSIFFRFDLKNVILHL